MENKIKTLLDKERNVNTCPSAKDEEEIERAMKVEDSPRQITSRLQHHRRFLKTMKPSWEDEERTEKFI